MSEQAAAYLVKSAMRSANRQQMKKQAFIWSMLLRPILGHMLNVARKGQVLDFGKYNIQTTPDSGQITKFLAPRLNKVTNFLRPLSPNAYWRNMARSGFEKGVTGEGDVPLPRLRNAISVIAPRLSGTADYEYARMIGDKMRRGGMNIGEARQTLQAVDPDLVNAAVHKHLLEGAAPEVAPQSTLWNAMKRYGSGTDKQINPTALGPLGAGAIEAAIGGPLGGSLSALSEIPGALVMQAAQEGKHGLLQKIKGALIERGVKANPFMTPLHLAIPELSELHDIGADLRTLRGAGRTAASAIERAGRVAALPTKLYMEPPPPITAKNVAGEVLRDPRAQQVKNLAQQRLEELKRQGDQTIGTHAVDSVENRIRGGARELQKTVLDPNLEPVNQQIQKRMDTINDPATRERIAKTMTSAGPELRQRIDEEQRKLMDQLTARELPWGKAFTEGMVTPAKDFFSKAWKTVRHPFARAPQPTPRPAIRPEPNWPARGAGWATAPHELTPAEVPSPAERRVQTELGGTYPVSHTGPVLSIAE